MIWDIDPKLPWHAALALIEIACLAVLVARWRDHKSVSVGAAAGLGLTAIAHVVYSLYFAAEHPYVGPYPLPWHGVFVLVEAGAAIFALWHWRKHGSITANELSWLFLAIAGHAFYTWRLADANPTFELEVRWYGVCFAIGLLLAARALPLYFERWGFDRKHGEALVLWTAVGMLLGAHFVHLIFYETESIWQNPIRIFQLGSGLASHGGGLGAILAVVFFARRHKLNATMTMRYMDPAMCGATWVIPWVRVGNFFNSEIVGRPWDGPLAVTFPRHECGNLLDHPGPTYELCAQQLEQYGRELVSRHPSQAYEAILAFVMVGLAVYLQAKWRNRLRPGAILFILLGYYFTTRFGIEYVKEFQTVSDSSWLTMGQRLSLPIVLLSLYMLFFSKFSNIRSTVSYPDAPKGPRPMDGERSLLEGASDEPDKPKPGAKRKKRKKKKP